MEEEYDDTLIDLPLDDLNNALDDSEAESEASDYSTAHSAHTHSFSDDSRSNDAFKEDTGLLEGKGDGQSLTDIKSPTSTTLQESTSSSSHSVSEPVHTPASRAPCASPETTHLLAADENSLSAEDVHVPSEIPKDNLFGKSENNRLVDAEDQLLELLEFSDSNSSEDTKSNQSETTENAALDNTQSSVSAPPEQDSPPGITANEPSGHSEKTPLVETKNASLEYAENNQSRDPTNNTESGQSQEIRDESLKISVNVQSAVTEDNQTQNTENNPSEHTNRNSTTTAIENRPSIPEIRLLLTENDDTAVSGSNPSINTENSASVDLEDNSHTEEEGVVKNRPRDRNQAASRPLSEISDVQIESTWFVQGPALEDNNGNDNNGSHHELSGDQESESEALESESETHEPESENRESELETQEPGTGEVADPSSETETTVEQEASGDESSSEESVQTSEQTFEITSANQLVETTNSDMGENARLEEKLKQFRSQAKEDPATNRHPINPLQLSELDKQRRRNLIFDEERFEETFLKCLICREVYNETDKLPKMLHCHHTFCMDCLYQMYRVEGEFRQSLTSVFRGMPMTVKIQCPTCREGVIISEAELRRLPNDHTIMELLSFVNVTGKNDVSYCPKHQTQPLNFFCEPCIMPVCCDCTVIDHKEVKGHKVVNVDEAMEKYTPILEETLGDIRTEKSSLTDKRDAIEGAQRDLDRVQTGITDQIRLVFDVIRNIIDERERELHDVAEAEVNRKRAILGDQLKVLREREVDLNTEFNSLQQAKDDKDLSLIFTGHKSARDLLAKKVHIPTNSTQGFSITFQYSSRSDSIIKQQVANLGDIIFHSS